MRDGRGHHGARERAGLRCAPSSAAASTASTRSSSASLRTQSPGPGQVLIDVHAAALSFMDTLMVAGRYQMKPELPFVPGSDAAGVVLAVGDGVERRARRRSRSLQPLAWWHGRAHGGARAERREVARGRRFRDRLERALRLRHGALRPGEPCATASGRNRVRQRCGRRYRPGSSRRGVSQRGHGDCGHQLGSQGGSGTPTGRGATPSTTRANRCANGCSS